jgi:hypothetical protein
MTCLEELEVGGRNITDDGVLALCQLKNLKRLGLQTSASPQVLSELQRQLPACQIYGN